MWNSGIYAWATYGYTSLEVLNPVWPSSFTPMNKDKPFVDYAGMIMKAPPLIDLTFSSCNKREGLEP